MKKRKLVMMSKLWKVKRLREEGKNTANRGMIKKNPPESKMKWIIR